MILVTFKVTGVAAELRLNTKRRYKSVLRGSANEAISLVANQWAYFSTSILKWNLAFMFFNASLFVS